MNKLIFTICLLLFCVVPVSGQGLFNQLVLKEWKGSGTLMGTEATFIMTWNWTLDKNFVRLEFSNQRSSLNKESLAFKAHAYYKVFDGSTVEGMWFDSRGIYFPLSGTITETQLTVNWGTPETEQGRTIYTLKTPTEIEVADYILKNGAYLQFGSAVYK